MNLLPFGASDIMVRLLVSHKADKVHGNLNVRDRGLTGNRLCKRNESFTISQGKTFLQIYKNNKGSIVKRMSLF